MSLEVISKDRPFLPGPVKKNILRFLLIQFTFLGEVP